MAEHRTHPAEDRSTPATQNTLLAILRSHLANERTHLAYLRTSIALIGFGITLNRFAIYLIQNARDANETTLADVKHVGLSMVLLGIATALWALFRYRRAAHDIERQTRHHDWRAVALLTIGFILLGTTVAVWLFVRQ